MLHAVTEKHVRAAPESPLPYVSEAQSQTASAVRLHGAPAYAGPLPAHAVHADGHEPTTGPSAMTAAAEKVAPATHGAHCTGAVAVAAAAKRVPGGQDAGT